MHVMEYKQYGAPEVFEYNELAKHEPVENAVSVNCKLEWFQTLESF
jgi:hypothetical protein